MAISLPHIEDSANTIYYPPKGDFETFIDNAHYAEKMKEWGLSATKKEFWYKERTHQRLVTIKGYEVYGETNEGNTLVIEFQDGSLSCIHPAYLKEMQAASFGKNPDNNQATPKSSTKSPKTTTKEAKKASAEPKKATPKKEKQPKLVLPTDKVHFTALVKQFALTWNNFNEENDEVVILEDVVIHQEEGNPVQVGLAWCSHSKTLKKLELQPADNLEFDGKIVRKKLPKGKDIEDEQFIIEDPVLYKVNNPSKIKKS